MITSAETTDRPRSGTTILALASLVVSAVWIPAGPLLGHYLDVHSFLSATNPQAALRILIGLSGSIVGIVLGKVAQRRLAASGDAGPAASYARIGVRLGWLGLFLGAAFQYWFVLPDTATSPAP